MGKFRQIETFVAVVQRGSLTAAAQAEGVAPAMIGRRLDALEARLGVKLLLRSTRRLVLTHEGAAFLEEAQRILAEVANMEAAVSAGSVRASGQLRITAPAGFGRRHVAPLVPRFHALHPEVRISLNLSDRVVDLAAEGFDCGVRVGDLPDSSLVSVRLADNRRLCVATPEYLRRHGTPQHPRDLLDGQRWQCLTLSSEASQTRGWAFMDSGALLHIKPTGPLDCTDGQVLHAWCLQGHGIAWRSTWEVDGDVAAGRLVALLEAFSAPPPMAFTPYLPSASCCRCGCGCGSTFSRPATAIRPTGSSRSTHEKAPAKGAFAHGARSGHGQVLNAAPSPSGRRSPCRTTNRRSRRACRSRSRPRGSPTACCLPTRT